MSQQGDMSMQKPPITAEDMRRTLDKARKALESSFKDYHLLLSDKYVSENKSGARAKNEKHIVDKLAKAASDLEWAKIGEGTMAIAIIALREHLMVRDRVNDLEYKIVSMEKEMRKLRKEPGK